MDGQGIEADLLDKVAEHGMDVGRKTIGHTGAGINWTRVAFSRVCRVFVPVPLRPPVPSTCVAFLVQVVRV